MDILGFEIIMIIPYVCTYILIGVMGMGRMGLKMHRSMSRLSVLAFRLRADADRCSSEGATVYFRRNAAVGTTYVELRLYVLMLVVAVVLLLLAAPLLLLVLVVGPELVAEPPDPIIPPAPISLRFRL